MATPIVPDHLAIIFDPENYDSWRHLANGYLYLPSGAKTGTGVQAIGLTGNLGLSGPIGNFWSGQNAILVMPGKDVKRLNKLAAVRYANVDALVADNFRAFRRIRDAAHVDYIAEYVAEVLVASASPELRARIYDQTRADANSLRVGVEAIWLIASQSGRQIVEVSREIYGRFIQRAGRFFTFNEMLVSLNRFVPEGAQMLVDMLPPKKPTAAAFYWAFAPMKTKIPLNKIEMSLDKKEGYSTVTVGQLRAAAASMTNRVPAYFGKALRDTIEEEGSGFSFEIEWLANPTYDPATRGYSVFMRVPPGSILYTIGRDPKRDLLQAVPLSVRGIWVINIPDEMDKFEFRDQRVRDIIHDYNEGDIELDGLYAAMRKLRVDVLAPNIYWTTRIEK